MCTRLRKEDEAELEAATPGETIEDILLTGVMLAHRVYVCDYFEDPVLMFGVQPHHEDPQVGVIWAVATPGIKHIRRLVVLHSKEWIRHLIGDFLFVTNMVDARNTTHIRWLQWAGAQFGRTVVHPQSGVKFLEFYLDV